MLNSTAFNVLSSYRRCLVSSIVSAIFVLSFSMSVAGTRSHALLTTASTTSSRVSGRIASDTASKSHIVRNVLVTWLAPLRVTNALAFGATRSKP
jgi:hypothetical protein